jgi:nicotinamide mononucleotide adenylyltransferase
MKIFTVRYRLKSEAIYRKVILELPDMETAVKSAYVQAKGMHGIPVIEIHVTQDNWVNEA